MPTPIYVETATQQLGDGALLVANANKLCLPMFDDHDTGAGSNSGVVLECEPLRGRVRVETDDGQLEFWRLADVRLAE